MKTFYGCPLLFLMALALLATPATVAAQVDFNGEFRPRTEFRNGYRNLHTSQSDPALFTSQRTRLHFLFTEDLYLFKISAQDVRTWGDEIHLQDQANINIHEAWAQLNIANYFNVKLGRQELVYDDQRLLGSVNWTQPGRSHEALVFKYEDDTSDLKADVGLAYNQERENILGNSYTLNNYKFLSYAWMNKDFGSLNVSGIFLTDGFENTSGNVNYRHTYGSYLNYRANDWRISGTLYFQRGGDNTRQNISAYMMAGNVSRQLGDLKITTGIDYLSGGKIEHSNPIQHSFNTLYATNHKFYGNMDHFLNIPKETLGGGLQDIYVSANYKPQSETNITLTYHHFSLAQKVTDPVNISEILNKELASEADLSIAHSFASDIKVHIGYSILFSTDTLQRIQQRNAEGLQQWGWVMLVLTPDFISQK